MVRRNISKHLPYLTVPSNHYILSRESYTLWAKLPFSLPGDAKQGLEKSVNILMVSLPFLLVWLLSAVICARQTSSAFKKD